jgi:hypothetical protein
MAVLTFTHKSTFKQSECLHFFHGKTQKKIKIKIKILNIDKHKIEKEKQNFDNTFLTNTGEYKEKEI